MKIKRGRVRLLAHSASSQVIVHTPRATLRRAMQYVAGATGTWSLFWRSLRAAWWCARAKGR